MQNPEFDRQADGTLRHHGGPEVACAVCRKPIKWCLDMFTFTTGFDGPSRSPFSLAHARCIWTPEAFDEPHHRNVPAPASPSLTDGERGSGP